MNDNQAFGRWGEDVAARWYRANGYAIRDRNWRPPAGSTPTGGELDLIVERGEAIVFCEVKTRRSARYGTGAEAVTSAKQARIRRLARAWLHGTDRHYREIRFDVAAVTATGQVEVIQACF